MDGVFYFLSTVILLSFWALTSGDEYRPPSEVSISKIRLLS